MSFVPTNYLTARDALARIVREATNNKQTMDNGVDQLVRAASSFQNMAAAWIDATDFIDAQAVAFPADETWQRLKDEKDQIVSDFLNMRNTAQAKRDAAQAAG